MANSRIIVFSFLLYTCFAAVAIGEFENNSETSNDQNNIVARDSRYFTFVGKVGSKSFYLDTTPRTWEDSVNFCAAQRMSIGRIETTQEGAFLSSKLDTMFYWVDGRDSGENSQFEFSNGEVLTTNVTITHNRIGCVSLLTSINDSFYVLGSYHLCSISLQVICQI